MKKTTETKTTETGIKTGTISVEEKQETKQELRTSFNGHESLRAKIVEQVILRRTERRMEPNNKIKVYTSSEVLSEMVVSDETYVFEEITVEQLKKLRKSEIPSIVYKNETHYYWAEIPKELSFVSAKTHHVCAECHRLSAAADEDGGCQKVRERAARIERHEFVVRGYETFNTDHDVYVVLQCSNFMVCPPRKQYTKEEKDRLRMAVGQYVYPQARNIKELNDLKEEGRKRAAEEAAKYKKSKKRNS